jgi:hypothetical protein
MHERKVTSTTAQCVHRKDVTVTIEWLAALSHSHATSDWAAATPPETYARQLTTPQGTHLPRKYNIKFGVNIGTETLG